MVLVKLWYSFLNFKIFFLLGLFYKKDEDVSVVGCK